MRPKVESVIDYVVDRFEEAAEKPQSEVTDLELAAIIMGVKFVFDANWPTKSELVVSILCQTRNLHRATTT